MVDETYVQATASEFVLAIFVQRCIDKSSTVRAKAMASLSKCVGRLMGTAVPAAQRPQWLQAHTAILIGDRYIEFDFKRLPDREAGDGEDAGMDVDGAVRSPMPPASPGPPPQSDPSMFVWRDAAALPAAATAPVAATPTAVPGQTPTPAALDASTPVSFAPQSGVPTPAAARSMGTGGMTAVAPWPQQPPHVLDLLACHAADGRAAARKAAVQLVAVLVSLFRVAGCPPSLQAESLKRGMPLLAALAADTSVSVGPLRP